MACSFIPRGCRPTRVNRGYRGCAAEIGCIVYQRPPLTILSQSLTYSGVNGIGWFTDGSLWLDMGHNFAKSQVLVVVVIPCHKSVPIRNLSPPPPKTHTRPGCHLCRKFACKNNYGYIFQPLFCLRICQFTFYAVLSTVDSNH